MTLETLSRKQVRVGIREGLSMEGFANKCGCSTEDVEKKIILLYKGSTEETKVLQAIAKNTKASTKKPLAAAITELLAEKGLDETGLPLEEPEPAPKKTKLDELKEAAEALSQEVMAIESEHKKKLSRYSDVLSKTKEQRDAMQKLFDAFNEKFAKCEDLMGISNQLAEEMNALLGIRRDKKVALEDIRKKIDDLNTIIVCAYADGTITLDGEAEEHQLDDSGYESLVAELVNQDACNNLKVTELKILARLLKIVEHSTFKIEVVCDNPDLEKVYKELSR